MARYLAAPVVAASLVVTALCSSKNGLFAHSPSYFHFHNITKNGDFEAGHTRGNPGHWIARYEHQQGPNNRGNVRWSGGGSKGMHVWDLQHGQQEADQEAHHPHVDGPGRADRDPDCPLLPLRREHSTLITRDCSGNPLEPPGVRLSPGPPRPRPQPPPPPPAPNPATWRPWPEQQPTNVFLHVNKRGGWVAKSGGARGDPPRGFEPTSTGAGVGAGATQAQDHLRGMKHADKPLMFGDGSYQANTFKLLRLPVKLPMKQVVKPPLRAVLKPLKPGPVKGGPLKVPLQLAPIKSHMKPGMMLKPVLILMPRPAVGNKNKGTFGFKEWISNMWNGG